MNKKLTLSLNKFVRYAILIIYCLFSLFPFIWMVSASFKRAQDVLIVPIRWIPPVWQPGNYLQALLKPRFVGYSMLDFLLNSIFVASITAILSIVLATFTGYGFAKF